MEAISKSQIEGGELATVNNKGSSHICTTAKYTVVKPSQSLNNYNIGPFRFTSYRPTIKQFC